MHSMPLGETCHGFQAFLDGVLSKLNHVWPGLAPAIDKVGFNETDVIVYCKFSANGGLNGKNVHQCVVKDEMQFAFDIY